MKMMIKCKRIIVGGISQLAFLLLVMISSSASGQGCTVDNAFNPVDTDGNCWFEKHTDRKAFFNTLITKVKAQSNGALISLRDDVFMASFRMDNDLTYDNKEYQSMVIIKGNTLPQHTINMAINEDYPARFFYRVHFWVGQNISLAEFNLDREIPGGYFGSELVTIPYVLSLTDQQGLIKSKWLKWVSPLAGETKKLQLKGS